ncbi:CatB-related O-acetyltransferase [Paenibacillus glufosinatiresistens]|uniref:CatB-related O-acetyltransferase n=1 Tax=Paenibacillus glufosinatiresistens TaxID=3070657 RepID=UPI00286E2F8C|nr:CatB-related O-acetyltransferase [Paenibacillus sp. YX.27]
MKKGKVGESAMIVNLSVAIDEITEGISEYLIDIEEGGPGFPLATIGRYSYISRDGDRPGTISSGLKWRIPAGWIAHNLQIGQFTSIAYGSNFTLGMAHNYANLSTGVSRLFGRQDAVSNFSELCRCKGQILIQNDVWIGHDVTVMPGVTIHNGAVVAANSHVVNDVPPYAIVGGNPARIIRYRFSEDIIKKLQTIQWWNWDDRKISENSAFFTDTNVERFCELFYEEGLKKKSHVPDIPLPQGELKYVFFGDFAEPFSLWQRIIKEFVHTFRTDQERMLIILVEEQFAAASPQILSLLATYIDKLIQMEKATCSVQTCLCPEEQERAVFRKADYWITNRTKKTILHSEYAYENGVKMISGVDCPVF